MWFYKWLRRYKSGTQHWFKERSRRPAENPNCTQQEIVKIVTFVRQSLYNADLFHGPQAILWELEDQGVKPLPSERTIARILAREGLTHRRTGRYEPKGTKYPQWSAQSPGDVHQSDYVGPCYIRGQKAVRFYGLNSIDVATGRCATEPVLAKGGDRTVKAFWASWLRLGIPRIQQFDNELVFFGSRRFPRGMGQLIRLCLWQGVEPCFIPMREPWRNAVVEQFNHHWLQGMLRKQEILSAADLRSKMLAFEQRHNSRYRYSKLKGKTPLQGLAACRKQLIFPSSEQPPRCPIPKPETGRYHFIRFIRSDARLDLFGETFHVPSETVYEYVRATVDVANQKLTLFLDNTAIDEKQYFLR
jgi:transposase InsO family protein